MRNKLLLLLLALLSATLPAMAYDFMVDGLCYNINSDGTSVTVTYERESQNSVSSITSYTHLVGSLNIPYSVTYSGKTYSVTSIGKYAFYMCIGLTSVTISNSVTSIGDKAFARCTGLTSVTLGNSVTEIGNCAFMSCVRLTSVTIPNSVTSIGNSAFENCSRLTSVTIPNSVTSIGESAFSSCSGLTSIVVNSGNTEYDSRDNCNAIIETSTNTLISGCKNTNIPNSVTTIGRYAFYGCSGLTSVTIPNLVTSIGTNAFYGCSGLTSVRLNSNAIVSSYYSSSSTIGSIFGSQVEEYIIGDNVTSIGNNAFWNCTSLTSVTIPKSVTSIGSQAFSGCSGLTSVIIPNSVTSIGGGAFSGCSGLTSVIIPNSVTSIGNAAFYHCNGLMSVTIGNSVTSIGSYAFSGCSGLTSVIIPNSVTSIGNSAFHHCNGLMSVTIGNSVTSIGSYAFLGCSGLNELYCYALEPPTLGSNCFQGVNSEIPVYVPDISAYIDNNNWNRYFTNFLPLGNNQKLTVNLPSAASGGKYKDMYIYAKNATTGSNTRCLVTDKMTYNLYVPSNTSYDITLENSIGTHFGEIKNVKVEDSDVSVTFSNLKQPQTVAMAVTLPDGEDVTSKVSVTWTDSEDNFLAQGASISGIASGMALKYEVRLPQDLAMEYEQPGVTEYTVNEGNNGFIVNLQPFGKSVISGTVCDKATGAPINRATATVSQILNGKHSISFTANTDNDGNFSVEVYKASSRVTIASQDYVSQTTDISVTNDSVSLGTLQLEKIDGTVININLTYQASVKQGETPTVQNFFEDYNNVSYSIYNKTQKKEIKQFSAQFPEIVLLEDINDGDQLTVTASSIKGKFNDVLATCVVNNQRASVTLPIVEHGAIEATCSQSQADDVVGMLFNSNGELVTRDDFYDKRLTLTNINDGNYTLVTMQANDYMNSVLTLSSLAATGLKAGDDYISSAVLVNSGSISEIQVAGVPAIDATQLVYTSNSTYFSANKPSVTVGNYVTLTANIDFKKVYQEQVSDISLIFDLPQGCEFVDNSVIMGNALHSYSVNNSQIIVSDVVCGEKIKFCVIPATIGLIRPSAMLHFSLNGKQVTQPIGSVSVYAKGFDISVPSTTNKPEIAISGSAPVGSSISIYDNGDLIGTTIANGGSWSAICKLPNAYNLSSHKINAKAICLNGMELMSETAECTYDRDFITVSKVTMYHDNPEVGTTYECVFDFLNPSSTVQSYTYYIYNRNFTFTIDFNDNDTTKISNVILYVKTGNQTWTSLRTRYDDNKGNWFASGEFGNMYDGNIPVNVAVSYDCYTKSLISAMVHDAAVNSFSELQADFNQEMAEFDEALNSISSTWSNNDYDEDALAIQRQELLASLGITIIDEPLGTYTEEEMEALLTECEEALNDSLNFQRDLLFQQSLEEINAMNDGIIISHCTGMTQAQLIDEGYEIMEKDDGTCFYIFTNESTMKFVDLVNDVYYEFNLQSENPMLAPIIASVQGDSFESKMKGFIEKLKILRIDVISKMSSLADIADKLMGKIIQRNFIITAQINCCENQIKYLKSLEHLTLDQSLRLARWEFLWTKYTKELALNNKIFNFLAEIDIKSLRLGKLKIKGLKWFGRVCSALDVVMQIDDAIEDISNVIEAYSMIPDPCPDDQNDASWERATIVGMGIGAGLYYTVQIALDITSFAGATAGIVGAAPSGGTTLSMTLASLGVALATVGATVVWEMNFDKQLAREISRIKQLKCYSDEDEQIIDPEPYRHHPGCPDVRPTIDPSGFVYEAVPSNRLQGVTATIYYKETVEDMYGEPVEQEVMWDAEEYAQKNPLFTDENGMYQWDVPQGMWQVRFNKNGYEPTRSEWLPVPPPQLDVNIGMTQLRQPEVAMVHAYKDGVVLTFDKYMRPETLTTDNISVTQNGENVTGTIELMNEEQGDNEKFASKLRFVPLSEFTAKTVTLNVKNNVESYAGIRMNSDFTQTFDIEKQIYVIGIDTLINVGYGESREVLVEALPVDVAKGKTLNVRSVQPLIAEVDNENYTLDKHGRATITVSGNLPGATSIILNVEGFDLKKNATVQVVDQSSLVTEKPIASVANGLVFDEGFTVELTCSTPGAVIYYTTNGACPCDEEERILYNGPITINTNTTLKAIAIAPGYYESDIATYYYFQSSAIDEISYDAPFKVSPTMVRDGFVVKGNFYECDVMLYSLNGSMVLHNEHVGSGEFVSLGSLNSGVYVAVVTINGRPYPVKIVKM